METSNQRNNMCSGQNSSYYQDRTEASNQTRALPKIIQPVTFLLTWNMQHFKTLRLRIINKLHWMFVLLPVMVLQNIIPQRESKIIETENFNSLTVYNAI